MRLHLFGSFMSIVKAEAVILKSIDFQETSKILTLYTREYGRVSVIAKGARKIRSRFGAALELLSHVSLVYFYKESREVHTLSDCQIVSPFLNIRNSVEKTYVGLVMVEVLNRAVHGHEVNPALFNLLVAALKALDEPGQHPLKVLWRFELRFSDQMGFKPEFYRCGHCEDPDSRRSLRFSAGLGRIGCGECTESGTPFSNEALDFVRKLQKGKGGSLPGRQARGEIHHLLISHMRYHIEELQHLKSLSFLDPLVFAGDSDEDK